MSKSKVNPVVAATQTRHLSCKVKGKKDEWYFNEIHWWFVKREGKKRREKCSTWVTLVQWNSGFKLHHFKLEIWYTIGGMEKETAGMSGIRLNYTFKCWKSKVKGPTRIVMSLTELPQSVLVIEKNNRDVTLIQCHQDDNNTNRDDEDEDEDEEEDEGRQEKEKERFTIHYSFHLWSVDTVITTTKLSVNEGETFWSSHRAVSTIKWQMVSGTFSLSLVVLYTLSVKLWAGNGYRKRERERDIQRITTLVTAGIQSQKDITWRGEKRREETTTRLILWSCDRERTEWISFYFPSQQKK